MEYPALVVYYTMCLMSAKAITKTWRWKLRLQQRNKYTLEQMLSQVPDRDKQSVLKDYCSLELVKKVSENKFKRNSQRHELTKKLVKVRNMPSEMTREILSYTSWVQCY